MKGVPLHEVALRGGGDVRFCRGARVPLGVLMVDVSAGPKLLVLRFSYLANGDGVGRVRRAGAV